MSKQSEIREGIKDIVEHSSPSCGLSEECWGKCGECGTERILELLDSQGVVIKKEGKLPEIGVLINDDEGLVRGFDKGQDYYRFAVREAGYTLTEPLMEE